MFLLSVSAALKGNKLSEQTEGIAQIVLCSFVSSQLCASIFHEVPSPCLCHRIRGTEHDGKKPEKNQNALKEQVKERSDYQPPGGRERKRQDPEVYLERRSQMESASEGDEPFWLS